jgi:hypothetical protein
VSVTIHPKRWLLLGPGGAGKTTLAGELSKALGLPVIYLDRHYWKPGWVEPSHADGCDEQIPSMRFLHWVATYKRRSRPKVVRMLRAAPHVRLFHLRSRKQATDFVNELVGR